MPQITMPCSSAHFIQTEPHKTLFQSIGEDGMQQVVVGPPQPVTVVNCEGMCVPTYGRMLPSPCINLLIYR